MASVTVSDCQDDAFLAALEPFGHLVNELLAFRARKLLGEVELGAVHPDPDVRGLELWLGSLRDARRSGGRS